MMTGIPELDTHYAGIRDLEHDNNIFPIKASPSLNILKVNRFLLKQIKVIFIIMLKFYFLKGVMYQKIQNLALKKMSMKTNLY